MSSRALFVFGHVDGECDFRPGSLFRLFADRSTGGTSAAADHVLRLGVVSLTVFLSTAIIDVNLAKTTSSTSLMTEMGQESTYPSHLSSPPFIFFRSLLLRFPFFVIIGHKVVNMQRIRTKRFHTDQVAYEDNKVEPMCDTERTNLRVCVRESKSE